MAKDRINKTQSDDAANQKPEGEGAAAGAGETVADPKTTPTGKPSKKGQPVPIGKRRELGLALRGLMAEVVAGTAVGTPGEESAGYVAANAALAKNEYTELRPQAERIAEVQTKLLAAIEAGNGTEISKLGKELNRIKMGL